MKQGIIALISFYQIILSPLLRQLLGTSHVCRYKISCSEFTKTNIKEYGIIRGSKTGLRRLMTCHQFSKPYGTNL